MSTTDALQAMAKFVATQLVGQALEAMVKDGRVAITVQATPAEEPAPRLALPPARRGRKPGKKRGRPRKTYKQTARTTARGSRTAPRPSAVDSSDDLATKMCRKCFKRGTTVRVAGTERTVTCTSCGCTWDARVRKGRAQTAPATGKRQTTKESRCVACDHTSSEHEDSGTGRCLSFRCVCRSFVR